MAMENQILIMISCSTLIWQHFFHICSAQFPGIYTDIGGGHFAPWIVQTLTAEGIDPSALRLTSNVTVTKPTKNKGHGHHGGATTSKTKSKTRRSSKKLTMN